MRRRRSGGDAHRAGPPASCQHKWQDWDNKRQESSRTYRDPAQWRLLFEGVAAGSGWTGDPVDAARAQLLAEALLAVQLRSGAYSRLYDDAGFCQHCDAAYCCRHRHVSATGYGHCPQGHGKSLDPHLVTRLQ